MSGVPTSLFFDRPLPYHRPRHALAALEVARRPEQLQPHLDRLDACDDVSQLFGALVDLFIGLAPDDGMARRAALDRYGHALSDAERRALEGAVEHGLEPTAPIPDAPHSLLTCGVTGGPLVTAATLREPAEAPEPPAAPPARPPAGAPPAVPRRHRARVLGVVGAVAMAGIAVWRRRARARRT